MDSTSDSSGYLEGTHLTTATQDWDLDCTMSDDTDSTLSLEDAQASEAEDSDEDSVMSLNDAQAPATMQATAESTVKATDSKNATDSKMSYPNAPIIRVLVGAAPVTMEFPVHKALMCSRSKFLRESVAEKEIDERKISLTEVEPCVFLIYLNILYVGDSIANESSAEWKSVESMPLPPHGWYLHMCKVYVLSKKLMDDTTTKIIFTRLSSLSREFQIARACPCHHAIQVIYHGTSSGDGMRMLLLKAYMGRGETDPFVHNYFAGSVAAEFSPEFLLDLSKNLYKRPGPDDRCAVM